MSFDVQWTRDGVDIPGAINRAYVQQTADRGHILGFRVVATNAAGSGSATSPGVLVPASGSVLQNLTISPASAVATSVWNATISGTTSGSIVTAVSSDGTTLTVTGTGTTRAVSGTFSAAGSPTVTPTETLVGATNTPHVSPPTTVTVSAAGSNFLADAAALSAMVSAGAGVSGGKTYTLAAVDFGVAAFFGCDFTSNPIVLQGTSTGDVTTGTRFTFIELAAAKGITFEDFNVYGANNGLWAVSVETGCEDLTFRRVTLNADTPEGTPVDGSGWQVLGCAATNIQIIGHRDNAIPDTFGRGNPIKVVDSSGVTLSGITMANSGADHCLLAGASNGVIDGLLPGTCYSFPGDHPDNIQMFGSSSTGARNTNILIKNCGMQKRPDPSLNCQGYFIAESDFITLQSCWFFNGFGNGVSFSDCDHVTIEDCYVPPITAPSDAIADITIRGATSNATLINNACGLVNLVAAEGPYPGFSETGTTILTAVAANDFSGLDAYLATRPDVRRRLP